MPAFSILHMEGTSTEDGWPVVPSSQRSQVYSSVFSGHGMDVSRASTIRGPQLRSSRCATWSCAASSSEGRWSLEWRLDPRSVSVAQPAPLWMKARTAGSQTCRILGGDLLMIRRTSRTVRRQSPGLAGAGAAQASAEQQRGKPAAVYIARVEGQGPAAGPSRVLTQRDQLNWVWERQCGRVTERDKSEDGCRDTNPDRC